MNRTRWLILTIVLLVAANIAHHIWKDWGLITIHCEDWPVGTVVHEIERQGHVTVKSNVPGETKVRMHVDKVPIAEALATLSVVTEARWRLAYFYAGDRVGIEGALGDELDEERKAAMVSNLLVVLCGERAATPVLNAGTLHN